MLIENQLDKFMHSMDGLAADVDASNGHCNGTNGNGDSENPKQELLLQQLQAIDDEGAGEKPPTWPRRALNAWKGLPFKAALGHVGLLFSLSMYCAFGGLVR